MQVTYDKLERMVYPATTPILNGIITIGTIITRATEDRTNRTTLRDTGELFRRLITTLSDMFYNGHQLVNLASK